MIFNLELTAISRGKSRSVDILKLEKESGIVLDYGCGLCRNTKLLLNNYVVDILDSKIQLEKIKSNTELENVRNIYFIGERITEKYDAILCSYVLNVLPNHEDRLQVLNHIFSLLRYNGVLVLEVRSISDVNKIKSKVCYNDGYVVTKGRKKTFQKGFDVENLLSYINLDLYEVNIIKNNHSLIFVCKNKEGV